MSGLFVVARTARPGAIIDDLIMIETCSQPGEYANRVEFLPMQLTAVHLRQLGLCKCSVKYGFFASGAIQIAK